MPVVVAINHFVTDTDAEVQAVKDYVATHGCEAVLSRHWELGSEGSAPLAEKVVELVEGGSANFAPIYPDDMPLFEKVETIAKRIYRADEVLADKKIRNQLKRVGRGWLWPSAGLYGENPVFLLHRSEPARRAHRSFGSGTGGAPVCRCGLYRCGLR